MTSDPINRARAERVGAAVLGYRSLRAAVVPHYLLNDPAWTVLLTIFSNPSGSHMCTLGELAEATGLTLPTTWRLIKVLIQEDVVRELRALPSPTFVLTAKSDRALERYLVGLPDYERLADNDPSSRVKSEAA